MKTFKSQLDLVGYVQGLAKDTMRVLHLLGIPEKSGMYERWEELTEVQVRELLPDETVRNEDLKEDILNKIDEMLSLAEDVGNSAENLVKSGEEFDRLIKRFRGVER